MSWEYKSKEAAFNFAQGRKPVPEQIVIEILNVLRTKNKKPPILKLEDCLSDFDLLLDVGCGSGGRIGSFTPFFKSTIGIDPSENLIDIAKKANVSKDITYLVGCGEELPVPDESVDLATFVFSAHYMNMAKVELELQRALKPNGLAVLHGYLVDGIDLLESNSNKIAFPELSDEAMKLWRECLRHFIDYANKTNHPERNNFDKLQVIYGNLEILKKRRMDDIKSYRLSNLEEFLFVYEQAVPFYKIAMKGMDFNPIKSFKQDLKRLWKIADADDKDVSLKITTSSYIIFLER